MTKGGWAVSASYDNLTQRVGSPVVITAVFVLTPGAYSSVAAPKKSVRMGVDSTTDGAAVVGYDDGDDVAAGAAAGSAGAATSAGGNGVPHADAEKHDAREVNDGLGNRGSMEDAATYAVDADNSTRKMGTYYGEDEAEAEVKGNTANIYTYPGVPGDDYNNIMASTTNEYTAGASSWASFYDPWGLGPAGDVTVTCGGVAAPIQWNAEGSVLSWDAPQGVPCDVSS